MKARHISCLLSAAISLSPTLNTRADDHHSHHDHHVSTTEKVVAGALVAGLALAAAKAIDKNNNSSHHSAIQPATHQNTRIVYIYDSRGTVPIYLRDLGNGSYVGPRGEYYGYLPSSSVLAKTYGVLMRRLVLLTVHLKPQRFRAEWPFPVMVVPSPPAGLRCRMWNAGSSAMAPTRS